MFGAHLGGAGAQMQRALEKISAEGRGVILYLRQRENNLGLVRQLETYKLMREKEMTFAEASRITGYGSNRDYGVGAQILHDLGLRQIRLLSNHPPRVNALEGFELEVVENVSI
jgi:3,4-dihydroxy 2-butanone 4-phosphate synthase/GTP cyclohydrolase II